MAPVNTLLFYYLSRSVFELVEKEMLQRNIPLQQLDNFFEPELVGGVEGGEVLAVDVEDAGDSAFAVVDWNDNLTAGGTGAGYVAGKLFYVGYDLCAVLCPGGAADSTSTGYAGTGHRTLEGTKDELTVDNTVETGPPPVEGLLKHGGYIGHVGYSVGLTLDDSLYLGEKFGVKGRFV